MINDYSWVFSLLSGVFAFITTLYIKRAESKQTEYSQNLIESIRYENQKMSDIINQTTSSVLRNNEVLVIKKFEALEKLWEIYIEVKKYSSSLILAYSVMLPEEYDKIVKANTYNLQEYTVENVMRMSNEIIDGINSIRPFISIELLESYNLLHSFIFRCLFCFARGAQVEDIKPWYEDSHCITLYTELNKKHNYDIDIKQLGSFSDIININESIFLGKIKNYFNGDKINSEIIDKSIEINRMLKNISL